MRSGWTILFIVLFIVLIAPVKLGIRLRWQGQMKAELALGVMVWGIRLNRKLYWPEQRDVARMAARTVRGNDVSSNLQQKVEQTENDSMAESTGIGWILRLIRTMATSDHARAYFRRTSVLERLDIYFRAGCRDAAFCALLDAAAVTLMGMLRQRFPHAVFQCRAALNVHCALQGTCIVRLRMGNLLASAAMGLVAYLVTGKKKEEKKWSVIPLKT